MEDTARKPYDGFMGTPYAKVLGIVLAFAVCLLILCLTPVGSILYLLVGIILYVIPRLFHVRGFKPMAALGIVFLVAATLIGAFLFSIPTMEQHTVDGMDNGPFSGAAYTDNGDGTYTFYVEYSGSEAPEVTYGAANCGFKTVYGGVQRADMTPSGAGYTATLEFGSGTAYVLQFVSGGDKSNYAVMTELVSHGDLVKTALTGNLYNVAIPVIAFFIILFIMTYMWRKAEEMRVKMEAEGRLYPKGEGVCKECGRIVLPGMTVCRCGAPIVPPENYRPPVQKKAEHFECSECGKPVPADSKTCPHCGAVFDDE